MSLTHTSNTPMWPLVRHKIVLIFE